MQVHYSKIQLEKVDQENEEQQTNIRKVEELIESLTSQYQEVENQEEQID
uniref:Uncharacterized protein n=1 Tax=Romanomermis culicivorax TaxID=13658 RepID=A0A915I5K7_ROMCU